MVCYDFDGVVCDSVDESSTAAWKHGKQLWPGLRWGDSPEAFLEPMRLLRPVVETGWENTLIMRRDALPAAFSARFPMGFHVFSRFPLVFQGFLSRVSVRLRSLKAPLRPEDLN